MLKRRFYDVLLIVLILLAVGIMAFQFIQTSKNVQGASSLEERSQIIGKLSIFTTIIYGLEGIYYIFILILAIQLHKKDKLSISNTIVVALLIPLAPIFYLATLRKPLKEFERGQVSAPTTTPTQPQP